MWTRRADYEFFWLREIGPWHQVKWDPVHGTSSHGTWSHETHGTWSPGYQGSGPWVDGRTGERADGRASRTGRVNFFRPPEHCAFLYFCSSKSIPINVLVPCVCGVEKYGIELVLNCFGDFSLLGAITSFATSSNDANLTRQVNPRLPQSSYSPMSLVIPF